MFLFQVSGCLVFLIRLNEENNYFVLVGVIFSGNLNWGLFVWVVAHAVQLREMRIFISYFYEKLTAELGEYNFMQVWLGV